MVRLVRWRLRQGSRLRGVTFRLQGLSPRHRALPAPPRPSQRHLHLWRPVKGEVIEVVFAVDTTGSMGGLIEGAKRTVWAIAKHIGEAAPNATLRVGLVAYRDKDDAYVTRPFALTDDLDKVYAELASYEASGGGDQPEHVRRALAEAVHGMAWTPVANKMIFLVGDAPAAERADAPTLETLTATARGRDIVINTIRCGDDAETALAWRRIAAAAGGDFASIAQSGGVQTIATPYDDQISALADEVDRSIVYYGDASTVRAAEVAQSANMAAPAAAKADRAAYKMQKKSAGSYGKSDIVGLVAGGSVALDAIEEKALPAPLQALPPAARAGWIAEKAKSRAAAEAKLADLQKQRDAYLRANAAKGEAGFDAEVKRTVDKRLRK